MGYISIATKNKSVETNFSRQLVAGLRWLNVLSWRIARQELLITCGSELTAKHVAPNTLHYPGNSPWNEEGNAADLRTFWYSKTHRREIEKQFRAIKDFGVAFDLVYEVRYDKNGNRIEHWHLEYDPD